MRKELVFCSALILSASLAGCGYDDGSLESLATIAESCTTNFDCKSGNAIVGECVQGKCLRFCSPETVADDCELNTVCEGGLCRPIVPCPNMQLNSQDAISAYKNKQCIQVFSTTPGVSWFALLSGDVVVDTNQTRNSASTEDFASDNYDFVIPHESLYAGMNFSIVTLAAITYLRLLMTSATMVAECTKPEIPVYGTGGQVVSWKPIDNYTYTASYEYTPSNARMNMGTLLGICKAGTDSMNADMQAYYKYWMDHGNKTMDEVLQEYVKMVANKPICNRANIMIQILEGISSVVMEMGMSSTLESTTLIGAQQILAWLNEDMNYQYIYDNSKEIWNQNIMAGTNRVDRLGVFPVVSCDVKNWKANASANAKLASRMNQNFYTDPNAIDWETGEPDFTRAKDYVYFCNEIDAANEVTECDTNNENCVYVNSVYYQYDDRKAQQVTGSVLIAGAMQSQLHSCIYMMTGMTRFPLLAALGSNPDMQFAKCANNEYRVSAMIDVAKLQTDDTTRLLLALFQGNQLAMEQITQSFVDTLSVFADKEVIYTRFTDPTLIWLSGNSYMPLEIREKSTTFSKNDLILQVNFSSIDDLFKASTASNSAITGPISLSVVPEMYVKKTENANPDAIAHYEENKENKDKKYLSSLVYKSGMTNESIASVVPRSNPADPDNSACSNCRFYYYAEKQNQAAPMVCGGFTYKTNQVNGYIVLTDEDLKTRVGKRDVTRLEK